MPAAAALDPTLVRHYGDEAGCHAHEHAQVLCGLDGTLQLEVNGHAAFVDAACGLVVPPGALHAYRAERPARVLVLDCAPGPGTDRFRRFALPPGWRTLGLPALWGALAGAAPLKSRRVLDLAALAARVDADLARPWTVAELAAACRLSPQRFRARFAELTGSTPLAFVRARRLDRAARLLRQGWPLDAVALQVGYASASALSHAMRRDRDTGARALRDAPAAAPAPTPRRALLET